MDWKLSAPEAFEEDVRKAFDLISIQPMIAASRSRAVSLVTSRAMCFEAGGHPARS